MSINDSTVTISASEARSKLSMLLDMAYYQDKTILIMRMGKVMVKITKAEPTTLKPERDLTPFIGAWGSDGEKIRKEMRKFRKNFKLFRD